MLEKLKHLNNIEIFSIHDEEFKKYGDVIKLDTNEIVTACEKLGIPKNSTSYEATVDELENLEISPLLRELTFGGCTTQIGLCKGMNSLLNAFEYHKSNEINIAVTPLVLILGLRQEISQNGYDSKNAKAFYLEKGDIIEIFSTSLHFCPCQVSDNGFSCVVVLPKDSNTILDKPSDDKLLFKKNKWIICHENNTELISKGICASIYGENYEIKY